MEVGISGFNGKQVVVSVGNISISIVASGFHYCSPREDDLPFGLYTAYEVGILRDGKLIRPEFVGLGEFSDAFEPGDSPVAGWVDAAIVQAMIDKLRSLQNS
jgi:hypothetical protein